MLRGVIKLMWELSMVIGNYRGLIGSVVWLCVGFGKVVTKFLIGIVGKFVQKWCRKWENGSGG